MLSFLLGSDFQTFLVPKCWSYLCSTLPFFCDVTNINAVFLLLVCGPVCQRFWGQNLGVRSVLLFVSRCRNLISKRFWGQHLWVFLVPLFILGVKCIRSSFVLGGIWCSDVSWTKISEFVCVLLFVSWCRTQQNHILLGVWGLLGMTRPLLHQKSCFSGGLQDSWAAVSVVQKAHVVLLDCAERVQEFFYQNCRHEMFLFCCFPGCYLNF